MLNDFAYCLIDKATFTQDTVTLSSFTTTPYLLWMKQVDTSLISHKKSPLFFMANTSDFILSKDIFLLDRLIEEDNYFSLAIKNKFDKLNLNTAYQLCRRIDITSDRLGIPPRIYYLSPHLQRTILTNLVLSDLFFLPSS